MIVGGSMTSLHHCQWSVDTGWHPGVQNQWRWGKTAVRPPSAPCTGRFRKPLVPADGYTNRGIAGIPDLKAGISRGEEEFFAIAGAVRNMGFPVDAEGIAIGINNGNGIV